MEEVYTSEGNEEEKPTHVEDEENEASSNNDKDDECSTELIIEDNSINPINAFEMFEGKIFFQDSNPNSIRSKIACKRSPREEGVDVMIETPMQRLSRLRTEIMSLENDVMSSRYIQEHHDNLLPHIKKLTNILDKVTHEIDSDKSMTTNNMKSLNMQEYPNDGDGQKDYELDRRLKALEDYLGMPKMDNNNEPILERLNEIEALMQSTDEDKINATMFKTKIIRSDLEAALKAKSKLSSSSSSDDANIISSLYNQYLHVSNVSTQLPTIIQRLETLSVIHKESSTFAKQLQNVDKDVRQLEKVISCVEEGMGCLEVECKNNLSKVYSFIEDFDQRFKDSK